VNRERVNAFGELARKHGVNHSVTLDAIFSAEGIRDDGDAEMGLAAFARTGVSGVPIRFIGDREALWRESLSQLVRDDIPHRHDACLTRRMLTGQPPHRGKMRKS